MPFNLVIKFPWKNHEVDFSSFSPSSRSVLSCIWNDMGPLWVPTSPFHSPPSILLCLYLANFFSRLCMIYALAVWIGIMILWFFLTFSPRRTLECLSWLLVFFKFLSLHPEYYLGLKVWFFHVCVIIWSLLILMFEDFSVSCLWSPQNLWVLMIPF